LFLNPDIGPGVTMRAEGMVDLWRYHQQIALLGDDNLVVDEDV
jgi:hypothetical protein